MPRISKVYRPKDHADCGFLFDIQNHQELQEWWDNVLRGISTQEFNIALKQRTSGSHHRNMLNTLAAMWDVPLLAALSRLQTDRGVGMDRVLVDCGRLFVNSLGGYFGYFPDLEISETRAIGVYALPTEFVRIIQWGGGTHFYAKIGNADVIVDGKMKWDTHEKAEAAGKIFLKSKQR